jgi:hypothetical protein
MNSEPDRLPFGLAWDVAPASWHFDGNTAHVSASGQTDNFVGPTGSVVALERASRRIVHPR